MVTPKFKTTKKDLSITLHLDINRLLALNVSIILFNGSMYNTVINMHIFIINNVSIILFNGSMYNTVIHLA